MTQHITVEHNEDGVVLCCKNCDQRYSISLPSSAAMIVAVGRTFVKEHRRCKAAK